MINENSAITKFSPTINNITKYSKMFIQKYDASGNIIALYDDPEIKAYIKKELSYYADITENQRIKHLLKYPNESSGRAKRQVLLEEIQKNDPTLKPSDILKAFASYYIAINSKTYGAGAANQILHN